MNTKSSTPQRRTKPATRKPESKPEPNPALDLAQGLGHTFRNPHLLELALTHRSLSYETNPESLADPRSDNEQLEFLGDAILGLVIAESLYRRFPGSREGELTRLRASIVSRRHLGEMALRLDLGSRLLLGRGEERSGGRTKPALLSNALEAVIAALYLDAGLPTAAAFIDRHILAPALPSLQLALDPASTFSGAVGDHKSALQEHLQAAGLGQPQYILTGQSGPDHQKRFRVEVRVHQPSDPAGDSTTALASAEGTTKKEAQQEAARLALTQITGQIASRPARQPKPTGDSHAHSHSHSDDLSDTPT
ncbi:MAG TPA: ribonuclease III [Granulicella sp.]|nr:ribonuclease III [Granulicella sp.]